MKKKLSISEQVKHNANEYIKSKDNNKNLRLTVRVKKVKTKKLKKDLLRLRQSFLDWDSERRRKVDLVIAALNEAEKYTDLEEAQARLYEIARDDELLDAAQKMLRLHYLELSLTVTKRYQAWRRTARARKKLKKWKKHHNR